MLSELKIGGKNMDKKISVRLREEEYEKIAKYAKEAGGSVSEFMRSRSLTEPGQKSIVWTEEMKWQLLNIKKHIDKISTSCPNINFKPIDDAMEVLWDELC